ncbi:MAG: 3-dehydroquinate synthase [Ignavibacteriae bacterium]|nr:3-dehydroquinate synthase [Ignavibacteriota bacterium]
MVHREIQVPLGERSYPIYIGSEMHSSFAPTCQRHNVPQDVLIITDKLVGKHYLRPLEKNLKHYQFRVTTIVIPPGEREKNLRRADKIFTAMLEKGIGRNSAVVALGGGVVGDLAGFVAAVYQRGVQFIQVPTTLLAQVDSAVGGKVAVNHPLGKNMLGAFYQPAFVWTDAKCLRTLPEREISCGLGEIIKYGVISDKNLFIYLEQQLDRLLHLDAEAVMHVQARCCEIKSQIVEQDEHEAGLRMVLNFGHTVGHALEAAGHYRVLKHGEAVLLGMMAESFLAHKMGLLDAESFRRIETLIYRVPLKRALGALKPKAIIAAMGRDKKAVSGKKRFVLPTAIGAVRVVEEVEPSLLRACVQRILGHRSA